MAFEPLRKLDNSRLSKSRTTRAPFILYPEIHAREREVPRSLSLRKWQLRSPQQRPNIISEFPTWNHLDVPIDSGERGGSVALLILTLAHNQAVDFIPSYELSSGMKVPHISQYPTYTRPVCVIDFLLRCLVKRNFVIGMLFLAPIRSHQEIPTAR
jgi:hypothetical protein